MTVYDEDFMKLVMDFDKMLEGDWFNELDKPNENHSSVETPQWKIHTLQYALRTLYTVIDYQMHETNRMHSILEKLPDTDEFKAVKQELKQVREEALPALTAIKKLTENLEESKNKKVDYIG